MWTPAAALYCFQPWSSTNCWENTRSRSLRAGAHNDSHVWIYFIQFKKKNTSQHVLLYWTHLCIHKCIYSYTYTHLSLLFLLFLLLLLMNHNRSLVKQNIFTLHHSDNTSKTDFISYLSQLYIVGSTHIVLYAWIMSSSVSWVKLVDFYVTVVAAKKGNRCLWNPPGLLMEHNKDAIWQFLLSYHCSAHSFLTLVPRCLVVFECK